MRAHLLAPDWSVWRQVGLDYISRLNWSKQGLPLVLAADKFDMGENTMKVSKVKGIDLRKKGSVVVNKEEEEKEEKKNKARDQDKKLERGVWVDVFSYQFQ